MPSFAKTAASLACLVAAAMATPVLKRGETHPVATTTVASPSTSTTSTPSYSTYPAACKNGTKGSLWQPSMYNVFPEDPDHSEPSVSYIDVRAEENGRPKDQVIVFRGIPAGAKSCAINWDQAAESERNFTVYDSGYVSLLQLDGFPYGVPVTWNSVAAFEPDGKNATHADFTYWDKQSKDAFPHLIGPVDCGEEIYVRLAIDTLSGYGRVFMDQDKKNGFHIDYTC
ncbi:hypothetical protein F5Y11DRAFT_344437 [Daldinia sp. FL1419]|nr:hypothetical protein F5Y11DRAFT_344437 [Daldinia sp. FL1419]